MVNGDKSETNQSRHGVWSDIVTRYMDSDDGKKMASTTISDGIRLNSLILETSHPFSGVTRTNNGESC